MGDALHCLVALLLVGTRQAKTQSDHIHVDDCKDVHKAHILQDVHTSLRHKFPEARTTLGSLQGPSSRSLEQTSFELWLV